MRGLVSLNTTNTTHNILLLSDGRHGKNLMWCVGYDIGRWIWQAKNITNNTQQQQHRQVSAKTIIHYPQPQDTRYVVYL